MTTESNPWQDMPESTQRRIKSDTCFDLYWITDLEGKYGFLLQSKDLFDDVKLPINLKGIELLKRNSSHGYGELFLVLNKEGVANDINGYPKAPPSIRIWGGSTVQNNDMKALLPWIDWAYNSVKNSA